MQNDPTQTTDWPAEIASHRDDPNAWVVEKLDSDGDGGIDVTVFSGPEAEKRAREYAAWKYGVQQ